MYKIVRLYRPDAEDLSAIKYEQEGEFSAVPSDLKEEIDRYKGEYLSLLSAQHPFTNRQELGSGNIGVAVLFMPEEKPPFVRKTFHGSEFTFSPEGLNVQAMNFMIDARVMRAMKGISIASQLQACSYLNNTLISEFKDGTMVTKPLRITEISDHQMNVFLDCMVEMHSRGVTIDNNPTNVLYDKTSGFCLIDAVPSSRLLTYDLEKETRKAIMDFDACEAYVKSGDFYDIRYTSCDISGAEQIFTVAKFMTYALLDDLPSQAKVDTADECLHRVDFQKVFLPCLYRIVGETKRRYERFFGDLYTRVSDHLDKLGMYCAIGTGWNAGSVFYTPISNGSAISDDPVVAEHIRAIKSLKD